MSTDLGTSCQTHEGPEYYDSLAFMGRMACWARRQARLKGHLCPGRAEGAKSEFESSSHEGESTMWKAGTRSIAFLLAVTGGMIIGSGAEAGPKPAPVEILGVTARYDGALCHIGVQFTSGLKNVEYAVGLFWSESSSSISSGLKPKGKQPYTVEMGATSDPQSIESVTVTATDRHGNVVDSQIATYGNDLTYLGTPDDVSTCLSAPPT